MLFSAIRRRVTFANIIAVLALVFAMSGGAYAASKVLITSTRQISPKVLKSLKGANGQNGVNGAAGPAGANGQQGPVGPQGPTGAPGPKGENGAPGAKGENGTTGFTEMLPSGKTLTGDWSLAEHVPAGSLGGIVVSSVSFGIPLKEAPLPVYIRAKEETPAGCTGNVEDPGAGKGHLCVFAREENNILKEIAGLTFPKIVSLDQPLSSSIAFEKSGADRFGFGILTLAEEEGFSVAVGTWAVTAE
jgi:hypothetical protein